MAITKVFMINPTTTPAGGGLYSVPVGAFALKAGDKIQAVFDLGSGSLGSASDVTSDFDLVAPADNTIVVIGGSFTNHTLVILV